jgi:hypothetical protein
VDICFDGNTSASLSDIIPPHLGKTDVIFAFDLSGSMESVIDGAKRDAEKLMENIAARFGSEYFGVAGFSDYTDIPYHLYHPLSKNYAAVQTAIDKLSLVDGGDTPEAYGRMLYESYTDSSIGWHENAHRYLIIFGDSYPHDPDSGRDEILGTSDDLILSNVLVQLKSNEIKVIYVANPGVPDEVLDQWKGWVNVTNGVPIPCDNP